MAAGKYDIIIEQGATFTRVLTWKPGGATGNLTGMSARMKIKTLPGVLILSLTQTATANGDVITLGGAAGTISILITSATTTNLAFTIGKYDLELVDTVGQVTRLLQGSVTFNREVTD